MAIIAEMTANLTPEVEDALLLSGAYSRMILSSRDPMYTHTVPKFTLYSLHQTEIHFRSPTYAKTFFKILL